MKDTVYDKEFYKAQQQGSYNSACVVIPLVLKYVRANSVLDVGCGV